MRQAAAVSALGITVFLVLSRPHLGSRVQVGPGLAAVVGVFVMLVAGHVVPHDLLEAGRMLWRPMVAITSIMLTAAAAHHLGVLDRLAATVLPWARGSAHRLFLLVFSLSAATAAVLNNDSAILVLTPLVVVLVRRVFPGRPDLVAPYVFAVFMSAGVAPLVTSNPMNLIVAEFAGLDFNSYVLRMLPVAVVGWVVTYGVLRLVFRRHLNGAGPLAITSWDQTSRGWRPAETQGLLLAVTVLGSYPVVSYFGGGVWAVAALGAAGGLLLCRHHAVITPRQLLRTGVSWEILLFLLGVFTIAIGLRNAGAVDWLSDLYAAGGIAMIGTVSAFGSALINNHSMALTNLLAIDALDDGRSTAFLAALVGGDLGPRLLPMGSLAGLLWFAALQRLQVDMSLWRFITVGTLVTLPSLAVSLVALAVVT